MKRILFYFLLVMSVPALLLAQGNFNTSLHGARPGKQWWYDSTNGGFERYTQVPISELGCVECHGAADADGNAYPVSYTPGCIDCHPSASGFSRDSIKVSQCYSCHGRQATEANSLGIPDVHRTAGFKCWDCHTSNDMHGSTTVFSSMLEPGAIEVDCDDCHYTSGPAPFPDHSGFDPASHGGKVHCTACHARTVLTCYNCHFESQVDAHLKRAKQPLTGFVMLANRTKDGKVYPMTFQSLTYEGAKFVAFGPFTSHTITDTGRTCTECHLNLGGSVEAITQYNAYGEMKFASWHSTDSTLSWLKGIVPMPADYATSFKTDFLTYNGATSDPVAPSKNWSDIGETWDAHHMFFATPLTKVQMKKLGFDTTLTAVREPDETGSVPAEYKLGQNYPNPFNPATSISFSVKEKGGVLMEVFNMIGQKVATLENGEYSPGSYTTQWAGTDDRGQAVQSGVYICRMEVNDFLAVRKMLYLK